MAAKSLVLEKAAKKEFTKLPLHIHRKLLQALRKIKEYPLLGIKLHGELGNYYKFRVGDYRIVYSFNDKESVIYVVKIEHRQGVYK
ncbi:MAG: Addiction module toxin, RelE/StbE [Candidatus Daviesbacteria bacterium GW2011_GWA2_38_24]|uniref:Addiction module toxin, RelE/StbE n=1 Tax=Candidatus Daviesbacteria bacterium GW2011_GWA2_38_24 TaxID=1618422 RepID=A0A0G0JS74_9BACT|nr:MAG: Addiction module toxin, RelE/StbE [Candidatus Daviesbacteria bacterium GW2011_GWA2_38_24]KKQ80871.1 MAG: Addiction module toxin, RelE/StbE [Candidatus Daviesbacteria bacterium GW2011_GWA1_38_7]OGE23644.1 MAG: hypothetical protein A2688_02355 [Candidatus Daviesbacteria bacterium RIFCSPHIGHO2_01_FULL_38_8]